MKVDMTNDNERWIPEEGWCDVEIITMTEGISKQGNPKFTFDFASAENPTQRLRMDITNIPGKRWLLRQILEACGIKPEIKEGKKIYDFEIEDDIEGKTISGRIVHDKTPFIGRDGNEITIIKPKIIEFKKLGEKK